MDHGLFPYYAVRLDAEKCRELDVYGQFRLFEFGPDVESFGPDLDLESAQKWAQTRRNKEDSA